jgi:hypothetical protein
MLVGRSETIPGVVGAMGNEKLPIQNRNHGSSAWNSHFSGRNSRYRNNRVEAIPEES